MGEVQLKTKTIAKNRAVELVLFMLLLLLYLGKQLPAINNPPWENYETWRQGDTYSIAVNFYQYEYHILRPQLNYDGPGDNYVQLEFQIMPFLAATLFRLLKSTAPAIPRAINLILFLGSAAYTYGIMRKFAGMLPSLCGLAIYLFMPITLLYSRAIMPESSALFFYCGGVYYLLRWYLYNNRVSVWTSAFFVAIAITQKTPTLFVGILILFVFLWKLKKDCIRSFTFYGYGAIALGIPAAYYSYASTVAVFHFVNGITAKHILTDEIFSVFTKKGISFFLSSPPRNFGWVVILFAGAGFLLTFTKERRFVLVWALSFGLEWATIVAAIKFGYYLIFMAPVFSVLCAIVLSDLLKWKKQIAVYGAVLLVCWTAYSGIRQSNSLVKPHEKIEAIAAFLSSHTREEDIIAIAALNPVYLNAANRRGYRANLKYYDYIPQEPRDEIRYFMDHGVTWFLVIGGSIPDDDAGYLDYLEKNYIVAGSDDNCTLFRLE